MEVSLADLISQENYPSQLLEAAEEMVVRGRYEVAVVTAQMACEVQVERTFTQFFRLRGIENLEEPIEDLMPSFNLGNDKVRRLYAVLTGDEIQRAHFWSEYKTMVSIRNKAVHAGARVQKSQAQMVLRIAKLVLKHLERVRTG